MSKRGSLRHASPAKRRSSSLVAVGVSDGAATPDMPDQKPVTCFQYSCCNPTICCDTASNLPMGSDIPIASGAAVATNWRIMLWPASNRLASTSAGSFVWLLMASPSQSVNVSVSGMLERKTVTYKFKLTAVALANKVARIVFALLTRGGQYDDRPVAA